MAGTAATPQPVCFIILNYDAQSHRHWFHLYHFVDRLAANRRVMVIIERCPAKPIMQNVERIESPSAKNRLLRSLQMFFFIVMARLRGYRLFYNHYTFSAARVSAIVTRLTGGKSFLWHCIPVKELLLFTQSGFANRVLFRLTFRLVHHIVTGSDAMARYYQRHFSLSSRKTIVVPNYIDTDRFRPALFPRAEARRRLNLIEEQPVFLYLHEMEPGRSMALPDIIGAIAGLRPDSLFLLVGKGSYRGELERRLDGFVQQGKVRFTGAIPNLEIPWYFAAADVYLVTSQFEAFSRTLLEAMAMGIPIAATDGGGFTQAYTPEALHPFLVSYDQIDQLPLIAVRLLENRTLRETLVTAGQEHVARFSETAVLRLFEQRICES